MVIGAGYVLPDSLLVVDTPAEVRVTIDELKKGDRVDVMARTRNWARVRLSGGRTGWVEAKALVDSDTYEAGQRLLDGLNGLPAQAVGHVTAQLNLHLEPARGSAELALLDANQSVEILGRLLVERPGPSDESSADARPRDAWYLVRAGSQAGWVLGRLVALDIPGAISTYAEGTNLVAWLVLNTVEDEGRKVSEYLIADRVGTQDYDFNHIRVLTWWKKHHTHATAYREGRLNGYFPIRTARLNGVNYFRLRLVDENGRKFQKVYALFDTVTRPIGIVEGWTSDAMPTQPMPKKGRRR